MLNEKHKVQKSKIIEKTIRKNIEKHFYFCSPNCFSMRCAVCLGPNGCTRHPDTTRQANISFFFVLNKCFLRRCKEAFKCRRCIGIFLLFSPGPLHPPDVGDGAALQQPLQEPTSHKHICRATNLP